MELAGAPNWRGLRQRGTGGLEGGGRGGETSIKQASNQHQMSIRGFGMGAVGRLGYPNTLSLSLSVPLTRKTQQDTAQTQVAQQTRRHALAQALTRLLSRAPGLDAEDVEQESPVSGWVGLETQPGRE